LVCELIRSQVAATLKSNGAAFVAKVAALDGDEIGYLLAKVAGTKRQG
jgi:hypothetical protein